MPLNMRFRFSPTKDGLVKVLGPLETEIMQSIWRDERSTVKKVHRKLSQNRDIAYTTGAEKLIETAKTKGWTITNIKDDWKTVFHDR